MMNRFSIRDWHSGVVFQFFIVSLLFSHSRVCRCHLRITMQVLAYGLLNSFFRRLCLLLSGEMENHDRNNNEITREK